MLSFGLFFFLYTNFPLLLVSWKRGTSVLKLVEVSLIFLNGNFNFLDVKYDSAIYSLHV